MSYFRSSFSKKILSSFLTILIVLPVVYFALPAKKVAAIAGFEDTVEPGPGWLEFLVAQQVNETVTAAFSGGIFAATSITAKVGVVEEVHQFWLKALAWYAAKLIVKGITAQTVNWINSGFRGNPAFVTNPQQFFLNVADRSVSAQLNNIPGHPNIFNKLCSPFQPQIREALIVQYLQRDQLGQCTFQKLIKNYSRFTNNFSAGGWNAWFSITQNMQNNPYGAYIQAQDELTLSVSNQQAKYQTQTNQGRGFLSYEKCDGTFLVDLYNLCRQDGTTPDSVCRANATDPNGGTCTTQTPGSVIESQLENNLGAGVQQLNLANDINQIVSALLVQGIKGIFGGISGGLRGLSQTQPGQSSSLVAQLTPGSPQSNLEALGNLASTTSGLPINLTQTIGTDASSSPTGPVIDANAITAQVQAEIDAQRLSIASSTSVGTSPICGNNICEGNESLTCPQDCGGSPSL